MSRRLPTLFAVAALCGCSTIPAPQARSWNDCARVEALGLLSQGVQPSWPRVSELPAGESMESVDLGSDPPDAIHDAFVRTLYLSRGHNAFYVHQTGGIAGVDVIYGPVSLHGHCSAPASGAP
jgi:hypothetical protein